MINSSAALLYGLDVKLSQKDGKLQPIAIEMNGVDSGTNSFANPDGEDYYRKFVRTLAACSNGKPIFMYDRTGQRCDSVQMAKQVGITERSYEKRIARMDNLSRFIQTYDPRFAFRTDWLQDERNFYLEKATSNFDDSEDRYYEQAARTENIELILFSGMDFRKNHITFKKRNGTQLIRHVNDIGLIRTHAQQLTTVPNRFRRLFIGHPLHEAIMGTKQLMTLDYFTKLKEFFPPTIDYGLGVRSVSELKAFVQDSPEKIVRKKGTGYCGIGVQIRSTRDVIDELPRHDHEHLCKYRAAAVSRTLLSSLGNTPILDDFVDVYQHFITGTPLKHPTNSNSYDGCARVIVCKPYGQPASILGSQWRLATHPTNDTQATSEQRHRANLSRGATPTPLTTEQQDIIYPFCLDLVSAFEVQANQLELLLYVLAEERKSETVRDPSKAIRMLYWGNRYRRFQDAVDADWSLSFSNPIDPSVIRMELEFVEQLNDLLNAPNIIT